MLLRASGSSRANSLPSLADASLEVTRWLQKHPDSVSKLSVLLKDVPAADLQATMTPTPGTVPVTLSCMTEPFENSLMGIDQTAITKARLPHHTRNFAGQVR